jgi:hypothetical protein
LLPNYVFDRHLYFSDLMESVASYEAVPAGITQKDSMFQTVAQFSGESKSLHGADDAGYTLDELLEETIANEHEHLETRDLDEANHGSWNLALGFVNESLDINNDNTVPGPLHRRVSLVRQGKRLSLLERRSPASIIFGNPFYVSEQEQLRLLTIVIPQYQPERIKRMYKIGARVLRATAIARDPGRYELTEHELYLYWPRRDEEPIMPSPEDDSNSSADSFTIETLRQLVKGPIIRDYSDRGWMTDDGIWHPGHM